MKLVKFLILFLLLFYISGSDVSACTIFTAKDDNNVLVGNNEDFMYQYSSAMWFADATPGTYGRVCFANSNYVQGGMNEKGLFYDGASCSETQVPYSENKPSLGMDLGEIALSRCADVGEVVELFKRNNIPQGFGDHLLFVDETGDSVIIEWVDNKMEVIPGDRNYQIATNFFISKPELGGYPCRRFDTVKRMLEESRELSVDRFKEILGSVTQSWDGGGTKYSNVYDLKNKKVYVYSKADFSSNLEYDLADELKKLGEGERSEYDIDTLLADKKSADAGMNAETADKTDYGTGSSTNTGITAAVNTGKTPSSAGLDETATSQETAVSGHIYVICGIAVFSAVLCIIAAKRATRQNTRR